MSGFIVETIPAVAFCWRRYQGDAAVSLEAAIRLGGDTDTVAAIVGALVGAELGEGAFPEAWREGICDWPLSAQALRELGAALDGGVPPPRAGRYVARLSRNLAQLMVILGHLVWRAFGR